MDLHKGCDIMSCDINFLSFFADGDESDEAEEEDPLADLPWGTPAGPPRPTAFEDGGAHFTCEM